MYQLHIVPFHILIYQCIIILCTEVPLPVPADQKPSWNNTDNIDIIIDWLLADIKKSDESEVRSYDGSYNNPNNYNAGTIGELLTSVYPYTTQETNAPDISKLTNFKNCFTSTSNGILYFFLGQQALLEIIDLDNTTLHNLVTPFIDGGILYGNSRYKSLQYRLNGTQLNENGHLITYDLETKPSHDIAESLTGIWYLWHNRIARKIKEIRKDASSEDIFNEARKWTIAIQQSIYMYEWLPFWTNENIQKYESYNAVINPQLSQYFIAAIYGLQNVNFRTLKDNPPTNDLNKLIISIYSTSSIDNFTLKPFFANHYTNEALQALEAGVKENATKQCGNSPYLKSILLAQFLHIRASDRFWFEYQSNRLFSAAEINKIRSVKFSDVYLTVKQAISNKNFSSNTTQKYKPENVDKAYLLIAFITIFIIICCLVLVIPMIIWKYKSRRATNINTRESPHEIAPTFEGKLYPSFSAREYSGSKNEARKVLVTLKADEQKIMLNLYSGILIRLIDCNMSKKLFMKVYIISDRPVSVIKFPHNYDLVLIFESNFLREKFLKAFDDFQAINQYLEKELIKNFTWKAVKRIIVSKQRRQDGLEKFFRVAIAQAFKIKHSNEEMLHVGADLANKVMNIELTKYEFADALNINLHNEFVTRMFSLIDRDKNGFISFREFVDLIIVFAEGNKEKKAKLLFDMYDIDGTGSLPITEFSHMMKSFLENTRQPNKRHIQETIRCMLMSVKSTNNEITFEQFKQIIGNDIEYLNYARLGLKTEENDNEPYLLFAKRTLEAMNEGKNIVEEIEIQKESGSTEQNKFVFLQNIQTCVALVFWYIFLTLLILFNFIINLKWFSLSRLFQKSVLNIICVSSAESLLFIYSILLITLCRNIWSALDCVFLRKYFPSNYLSIFYMYFLILSIFFTAIHSIAALIMLFTEDGILSYLTIHNNLILYEPQYNWCIIFDLTVITGILLIILCFSTYMFINLKDKHRNYIQLKFNGISHYMHKYLIAIIIVFLFHGSQRKLQNPQFFNFMSGPLLLYFVDIFIMLTRKIIEVPIFKVQIHPSDVICITMRRPANFQYTLGQKVRMSIPILGRRNYHEFWLTSAPCEPDLRIYIPVVDRWSHKVFTLFDGTELASSRCKIAPVRVRLEGPLGNGIEHWERYDVAIFIGDTSGISRIASVLKDITNCLKIKAQICCKKVYFIWTSDTHKQFEWLVDLIYETENNDQNGFFSCHIFITELYEKFDLRTILSFIFEKYYRRIYGKSIFMNLRALTHYSQPKFDEIFRTVGSLHPHSKLFGVFSSGSINFINSISKACTNINGYSKRKFQHHPYII